MTIDHHRDDTSIALNSSRDRQRTDTMGGAYSVKDTTGSLVVRGESERRERVDAVAFGTGTKDYSLWVRLSPSMQNVPHTAREGRVELCLHKSGQQRYPQV